MTSLKLVTIFEIRPPKTHPYYPFPTRSLAQLKPVRIKSSNSNASQTVHHPTYGDDDDDDAGKSSPSSDHAEEGAGSLMRGARPPATPTCAPPKPKRWRENTFF